MAVTAFLKRRLYWSSDHSPICLLGQSTFKMEYRNQVEMMVEAVEFGNDMDSFSPRDKNFDIFRDQ